MVENKKIKNASKVTSSGIKFKSHLERTIYNTLLECGITPNYESITFEFVPRIRPSVPFYNKIGKVFGIDMKPVRPITYTPDFTFEYDGMLVIIEAKGFENDVFYIKKNLFRRHLETLQQYSMYFEIRTKKELMESINLIKKESVQVRKIRKLILSLPEKDIPVGIKLLEERDWNELSNLVSSAIVKVEKSVSKNEDKYSGIDISSLYTLHSEILEFSDNNCNND